MPSSSSGEIVPLVSTVPLLGLRIPAIVFRRVDFPEPFAPMIPSVVPAGTSRSTPLRAQNSSYRFRRERTFSFSVWERWW